MAMAWHPDHSYRFNLQNWETTETTEVIQNHLLACIADELSRLNSALENHPFGLGAQDPFSSSETALAENREANPQRATLSIREVAELLSISNSSAYEAARKDDLPVHTLKIGGRFVVPAKPLLEKLGLNEIPELRSTSTKDTTN